MLSLFTIPTLVTTFYILSCSAGLAHAVDGDATYFQPGWGNCGAPSKATDYIVALSTPEYNSGLHCWQHIKISYYGNTIDATVVDSCPGCGPHDIDLSPAAFKALAPLEAGRIQVSWSYT